jgi:hypothetical protein
MNRRLLNDTERINHTARLFGIHFPFRVEPFIYSVAGNLSRDYRGGMWTMYQIDNGGFYMAPDSDTPFRVSISMSGYSGTLSADAFGIVVCLFAFSNLSFSEELSEMCTKEFHLVRKYVFEHPECRQIFRAID